MYYVTLETLLESFTRKKIELYTILSTIYISLQQAHSCEQNLWDFQQSRNIDMNAQHLKTCAKP